MQVTESKLIELFQAIHEKLSINIEQLTTNVGSLAARVPLTTFFLGLALREGLHWLERVLLNSPELPMGVTRGTHLMVITRVERDLCHDLFTEVKLSNNSVLVVPVPRHSAAVWRVK